MKFDKISPLGYGNSQKDFPKWFDSEMQKYFVSDLGITKGIPHLDFKIRDEQPENTLSIFNRDDLKRMMSVQVRVGLCIRYVFNRHGLFVKGDQEHIKRLKRLLKCFEQTRKVCYSPFCINGQCQVRVSPRIHEKRFKVDFDDAISKIFGYPEQQCRELTEEILCKVVSEYSKFVEQHSLRDQQGNLLKNPQDDWFKVIFFDGFKVDQNGRKRDA